MALDPQPGPHLQPSAAGANGKGGAAERASPAGHGGARDTELATTRATPPIPITTAVTSWQWRRAGNSNKDKKTANNLYKKEWKEDFERQQSA